MATEEEQIVATEMRLAVGLPRFPTWALLFLEKLGRLVEFSECGLTDQDSEDEALWAISLFLALDINDNAAFHIEVRRNFLKERAKKLHYPVWIMYFLWVRRMLEGFADDILISGHKRDCFTASERVLNYLKRESCRHAAQELRTEIKRRARRGHPR